MSGQTAYRFKKRPRNGDFAMKGYNTVDVVTGMGKVTFYDPDEIEVKKKAHAHLNRFGERRPMIGRFPKVPMDTDVPEVPEVPDMRGYPEVNDLPFGGFEPIADIGVFEIPKVPFFTDVGTAREPVVITQKMKNGGLNEGPPLKRRRVT